jgi:pyruvate,water dikinase
MCSLEEIRIFLDGGCLPDEEEIENRRERYLYIVKGGKFRLFSGDNARKVFLEEVGEEETNLENKQIKGNTAMTGVGIGKVRVILNKNEIPKFKNGEVLVTIMTNPDFVTIMKKSVAIVTDEGGILCHAAILSRELGIPCVVGTRIATKVLKNGDIVEVDAFNGLIKIVKQVII